MRNDKKKEKGTSTSKSEHSSVLAPTPQQVKFEKKHKVLLNRKQRHLEKKLLAKSSQHSNIDPSTSNLLKELATEINRYRELKYYFNSAKNNMTFPQNSFIKKPCSLSSVETRKKFEGVSTFYVLQRPPRSPNDFLSEDEMRFYEKDYLQQFKQCLEDLDTKLTEILNLDQHGLSAKDINEIATYRDIICARLHEWDIFNAYLTHVDIPVHYSSNIRDMSYDSNAQTHSDSEEYSSLSSSHSSRSSTNSDDDRQTCYGKHDLYAFHFTKMYAEHSIKARQRSMDRYLPTARAVEQNLVNEESLTMTKRIKNMILHTKDKNIFKQSKGSENRF